MITVYTRVDKNTILVEHETAKDARRRARESAPKAPGTRKIADKRRKAPKHNKPLREEY